MTHDTVTARTPSPGACLDDLLASRFLPKQWTARIWTESALPGRLQHCARNLPPDSEWRAYGDEDRIFFAASGHSTRHRRWTSIFWMQMPPCTPRPSGNTIAGTAGGSTPYSTYPTIANTAGRSACSSNRVLMQRIGWRGRRLWNCGN